ncbi:MAG: membrane integrity-associated transporter subunit PqiC [Halioglobus sp.]|nr:membrane integrity-associated transporter subunit PqiC [Halioglobus sp.]
MTKNILSLAPVLAMALLLTGCGSSPANHYYLLTAHDFPVTVSESPSVGVGPIVVPEYLNRKSMVYNRAGNALQVASLDLWAEPLADGIQRVVVLNLTGLLNTQDVQYFPWHPKRAPEYGVKVNILQLEAADQQVSLTAEWLVYHPASSETVQRRISKLQSPLPAGDTEAAQVAAAYSDLLYQLSDVIAGAIRSTQGDPGAAN